MNRRFAFRCVLGISALTIGAGGLALLGCDEKKADSTTTSASASASADPTPKTSPSATTPPTTVTAVTTATAVAGDAGAAKVEAAKDGGKVDPATAKKAEAPKK